LLFVLALLMISGSPSYAQVKVQVVTRQITKSIRWEPGMTLWIQAERAEIYCTSHAANTIDLDVKFIAKNENRKTAEEDLNKMKWLNETASKKIFLRNYIELEKNDPKPESDIKVIYHIKVPENCNLNVNNYFGSIAIENLDAELTIYSQFSKISLENITGNTSVKTTFGDVTARSINGKLHIESTRSDIDLSGITGAVDLQSNLAEIILADINSISNINIDADKSKIHLVTGNFKKFSFNLDLKNTDLSLPENMKLIFTKNEKDNIKAGFNKSEDYPIIDIKLNIGSLTIE